MNIQKLPKGNRYTRAKNISTNLEMNEYGIPGSRDRLLLEVSEDKDNKGETNGRKVFNIGVSKADGTPLYIRLSSGQANKIIEFINFHNTKTEQNGNS